MTSVQASLRLYLPLMEEIKVRIGNILTLTNGGPPLPDRARYEYAVLEIRMVCELIALACLVAHGDITNSNRLTKTYQADRIVSELEKLHRNFFPKPYTMTRTTSPRGLHLDAVKSGFLTKAEFLKLYHEKCGGILHRGSLKNLMSSKRQIRVDVEELTGWVTKIRTLLDRHVVHLFNGKDMILCMMDNGRGAVEVAAASSSSLP